MKIAMILVGVAITIALMAFIAGIFWLAYYAGYGYEAHKRNRGEK